MWKFFSLFIFFWSRLNSQERTRCYLLLFLMFASAASELLTIGAILPFLAMLTQPEVLNGYEVTNILIDVFDLSDLKELLLPISLLFAFSAILAGLVRLTVLWMQTRLSFSLGVKVSVDIFKAVLYQPYSSHLEQNTSDVIASITNKAAYTVNSFLFPFMTIVSAMIMILIIITGLLLINSDVALWTMCGFGAIYLLVTRLSKKRLARNGEIINRNYSILTKCIQEALGGIRDVVLDNSQPVFIDNYKKAEAPLRNAIASTQLLSASPRFLIEAGGMVLIALVAYIALAHDAQSNTSFIPVLGALALAGQRLLPVMQQTYAAYANIKTGLPILSDVAETLTHAHGTTEAPTRSERIRLKSEFTLEDITFSYSAVEPPVLRNLNLTIRRGERLGLIGQTGAGKSTLTDIIMGLLDPTVGCRRVDGVELTATNLVGWRNSVSHVPQNIFLADTTVTENIAFGIPAEKIDHDLVRETAKLACIDSTIESWERGFETVVGDRGVRISGGQMQRIGIARALYKRAEIIVFDEATSALDESTESRVMSSIENLPYNQTLIIVAHRVSTLRLCTRVLKLQDGNLIET